MDKTVLISLLEILQNEDGQELVSGHRGYRGHKGLKGDSPDYSEIFSYISNEVSKKLAKSKIVISDLKSTEIEKLKLKFSDLSSNEKNNLKLKFDDLTEENISEIRGYRGLKGRDGKDGKSFSFDNSRPDIEVIINSFISSISNELKLKFNDLTEDNISELKGLKGPRGQKGKDGKNFSFPENENEIETIIESYINGLSDSLKLKFDDLSEENKNSLKLKFEDLSDDDRDSIRGEKGLKGPRGQKGNEGKTGNSTYDDWLNSGNKGTLTNFLDSLKGVNGSRGEKGPRGQKGRAGDDGSSTYDDWVALGNKGEIIDFLNTLKGVRGLPGMAGPRGFLGARGIDGLNGKDALSIINIEIKEFKTGKFFIRFFFDDGSVIDTNEVDLPKAAAAVQNWMTFNKEDHHSGVNFIPFEKAYTIRENKQSIVHSMLEIDGFLAIDGLLVMEEL